MANQTVPLFSNRKKLILASGSPRRSSMLEQLGISFKIAPADVVETPISREIPADFARRMARAKAMTVARDNPDTWVIGADTVVTLGNRILGKPDDPKDALSILKILAGKSHQVLTGYCLCCVTDVVEETGVASTRVIFNTYDDDILQAYINTEEPLDKAGAYGIQGLGGFLVKQLEGSCANVIGLPIDIIVTLLLRHHVIVPNHPA